MTNREWLNSLKNEDVVYLISTRCNICANADKDCTEHSEMNCYEGCEKWLEQEYEGSKDE